MRKVVDAIDGAGRPCPGLILLVEILRHGEAVPRGNVSSALPVEVPTVIHGRDRVIVVIDVSGAGDVRHGHIAHNRLRRRVEPIGRNLIIGKKPFANRCRPHFAPKC